MKNLNGFGVEHLPPHKTLKNVVCSRSESQATMRRTITYNDEIGIKEMYPVQINLVSI